MKTQMKLAVAVLCVGALELPVAIAQEYPVRPVHITVPYAAGGGVDLTARIVAKTLSDQIGKPFVIENKPGASGFIGAGVVATSKPDGYSLLIAADTMTSAAYVVPNLTLDPRTELVPITQIAASPFVLITQPSVPASTVPELIKYAKDNPDKFRWGVGTKASPAHLAIERFNKVSGLSSRIGFYSGEAGAVTALLSGEVTAMLASSGAAQPLLKGGQAKAIAISTSKPSPNYPNLPTIASQGFAGFEAIAWYAVWGPKGLPDNLVQGIFKMVSKSLINDEVKKTVSDMGNVVQGSSRSSRVRKVCRPGVRPQQGPYRIVEPGSEQVSPTPAPKIEPRFMAKKPEARILVVGAGPVGLSLALDLAWRGHRTLVIDNGNGVVAHSKMGAIAVRTMEFCRRWGIVEDVRNAGFPEDYPLNQVFCTSLNGFHLATLHYPEHARPDALGCQARRSTASVHSCGSIR